MGPPCRRSRRGPDGGRRFAYQGPLPASCSCGLVHQRRTAAEVLAAEPVEAGPSRLLARRLEAHLERHAARPSALFGGEVAALALLSGPPSRGPPVKGSSRGTEEDWRPLDLYVGRNNRFGATTWGNPYKVGRDGSAEKCCQSLEDHVRASEVLWCRLKELRGRRLRCHCAAGSPCHADVLVRLFCEAAATGEELVESTATPGKTVGPAMQGEQGSSAAAPCITRGPAASAASCITRVPAVSSAPCVTRVSDSSSAPGITCVPAASSAPCITRVSDSSSAPGSTLGPSASAAPRITREPAVFPAPCITRVSDSSSAPGITLGPSSSAAPRITREPAVSPAPSITRVPGSSAPGTTVGPRTSAAPRITREPAVAAAPSITRLPCSSVRATPGVKK